MRFSKKSITRSALPEFLLRRHRAWSDLRCILGINEMDPPLCGSAVISHTEVSETDHELPARRTSPMQHELRTVAIDLAKKVWLLLDSRGVDVLRFSNLILATL